MLHAWGGLGGCQDIDFAALYKAYDDELMAWKAVIDERHRGEKKSTGPSHLSSLSPARDLRSDWLTRGSFSAPADPAIVMEITLIHWCVPSRNTPQNIFPPLRGFARRLARGC